MKTTWYFENNGKLKHPEAKRTDWVQTVLAGPSRTQVQPDGRVRHWGYIQEAQRWMRVVTLEDRETVLNAFFDRTFKP